MVRIRSANEIILSLQDFFKIARPDLDTKPGTVARDLFIEGPASQLSQLYDVISDVSDKQSYRVVSGSDLDKLAKNFGLSRKQPTFSSGLALITFSSIPSNVGINKGDAIFATNGMSFAILNGVSVNASALNYYKSVASKYRAQLDAAGISDLYAVEVTAVATTTGSAANIGKYSLVRTNINGASNVTNVNSFSGGTDQETDAAFRSRILSAFSGSSVGTLLGYQSAALNVDGVLDVFIAEPGSVLMTRDGTQTTTNSDSSLVIKSEGTGGKVDAFILGSNLQQVSDSFIYIDKSNNNDPTSSKNNFVLGQIIGDENKTINKRRMDDMNNGVLPSQPVDSIVSVSGSLSGTNFVEKTIDEFGRVSGNFELIKDSGAFGGSPFGFDTFKWIDNKISNFSEDRIKSQLNGQDPLTYSDVLNISSVKQNVSITNENSKVNYDRSIIELLHTPCTNVTRVQNGTTGERYIVINQNLDNTGLYNTTGRIKISGSTLPSPSDVLQVDYSWIVDFDSYSDFDGLLNTKNIRTVDDSIDWGFANSVEQEVIEFVKDTSNNYYIGYSKLPVSSIVNVNEFTKASGTVFKVTSGTFVNRLSVIISNLPNEITTIDSITKKLSNAEVYNTQLGNGSFTSIPTIVGINIFNTLTVIFPEDTSVKENDIVDLSLNEKNVFTNGNSVGFQITVSSDELSTTSDTVLLKVSYIALLQDVFVGPITKLPASKLGNGFYTNSNTGSTTAFINSNFRKEHCTVEQDFSNNILVTTSLLSSEYELKPENVLSIIRLSDKAELWNSNNLGTIITDVNGNFQLVFSGLNTPVIGDKVLVICSPKDVRRFQPFTFSNTIINSRISAIDYDSTTSKFFASLNSFVNESSITFDLIDPLTNDIKYTYTDGLLTNNSSSATLYTGTTLATIYDLLFLKVKISSGLNVGIYDIVNYDSNTNILIITCNSDKLSINQISVIRIDDGKELWSSNCNISNEKLIFSNIQANAGDKIYIIYYNFKNVGQAPTRIIATTTDQVINAGTLAISGTTFFKGKDVVFTATRNGLTQSFAEAIRKSLGLSSTSQIPSTIKLVKLLKLEKVNVISPTSNEVSNVVATYDVYQSSVNDNIYYSSEVVEDKSLLPYEAKLPNSSVNSDIELGDKLRVSFYYVNENDIENLSYTKNGSLYTNKRFAVINKVYVASGFKASLSTRLSMSYFTQPSLGARYTATYDYVAPKVNERIDINYNFNKLITDVSFAIENNRPINADVLVKSGKKTLLDLIVYILLEDAYKTSKDTIVQNVEDKLLATLTTTTFGEIIDTDDIISSGLTVEGVKRVRVVYFNRNGELGTVSKVKALDNEYFSPNNLTIKVESR